MDYKLLKLNFYTPVHFGMGNLATTDYVLHADTIFSAMCCELAKDESSKIDNFKELFVENRLLISDAMPYIQNKYYVPKPYVLIETDVGNSKMKKYSKKMKYIPIEELENYMQGKMDIESELIFFENNLVKKELIEKVSIQGNEQTEPYSVNVAKFRENSGLYLLVGYEDEQDYYTLEDILKSLGFSGIGGKTSSGYGKFEMKYAKNTEVKLFEQYLDKEFDEYISLSVSLPKKEQLASVVEQSKYSLIKRSGFVASDEYSEKFRRKNDIYLFEPGSVFDQRFDGNIYDVSCGGTHPVYRYALPLFMGVN